MNMRIPAILLLSCLLLRAENRPSQVLDPSAFPADVRAEVEEVAAAYRQFPAEAAILYQLGALHARSGHQQQALEALRKMAAVGAGLDPRIRDFPSLAEDKDFKQIKAQIQAANPPVLNARLAYTIAEGNLVPEGIAYSAIMHKLYLGSIKRKIFSITEDGTYEQFAAPGTGGLAAVLGLRVDDGRGELWAVSNVVRERTPDMVTGLFRFRLSDGQLIKAYPIPTADKEMLNDVAIGQDGSAYATASNSGALYRIDPKTDTVEKLLPDKSLPDPNGIAATADGKYLLVAGWYGITRVDLRTKQTRLVEKPTNVADGCLDGMYLFRNSIIGVQNCVHETGRIMRYDTAFDWSKIMSARVLESYNPMFDGVTTAAIAGNDLYFQANTQFRKVGDPDAKFDSIKILRLSLR
jgi:sugar lactone lactonase YvrE